MYGSVQLNQNLQRPSAIAQQQQAATKGILHKQ
jgi:hypothetical protein